MKNLPLILIVLAGAAIPAAAEEGERMPFPVIVANEEASITPGEQFARISTAVPPNAEVRVQTEHPMVVINVTPADANGTQKEGALPRMIVIDSSGRSALDRTLDRQKLKPGHYLMTVAAGRSSVPVFLQVQ